MTTFSTVIPWSIPRGIPYVVSESPWKIACFAPMEFPIIWSITPGPLFCRIAANSTLKSLMHVRKQQKLVKQARNYCAEMKHEITTVYWETSVTVAIYPWQTGLASCLLWPTVVSHKPCKIFTNSALYSSPPFVFIGLIPYDLTTIIFLMRHFPFRYSEPETSQPSVQSFGIFCQQTSEIHRWPSQRLTSTQTYVFGCSNSQAPLTFPTNSVLILIVWH